MGVRDHQAKEQKEGLSSSQDEEGISWENKDVNAATLCLFLATKLTGETGLVDYIGEFFEKHPMEELRKENE